MNAKEIIERIMTQHWDIVLCNCWVCDAARQNGFSAREKYLYDKKSRVIVEDKRE